MFCTPGGQSPSVCMPVDMKLKTARLMSNVLIRSSRHALTSLSQPYWQAKAERAKANAHSCQNPIEAIPLTCSGSNSIAILSAALMLTS